MGISVLQFPQPLVSADLQRLNVAFQIRELLDGRHPEIGMIFQLVKEPTRSGLCHADAKKIRTLEGTTPCDTWRGFDSGFIDPKSCPATMKVTIPFAQQEFEFLTRIAQMGIERKCVPIECECCRIAFCDLHQVSELQMPVGICGVQLQCVAVCLLRADPTSTFFRAV